MLKQRANYHQGPYIIGLTGGIASGKSTLGKYLADLGYSVIDADHIARDIVKPGQAALAEIVQSFGEDFLLANGELNRAKMRELIFNHPQAKAQLEAITHPRIHQAFAQACLQAKTPLVFAMHPLMIETGIPSWLHELWVVDVPEDVQLSRACQRDGQSPQAIEKILAAQTSRNQRRLAADWLIDNHRPWEEVEADIQVMLRERLQKIEAKSNH